MGNLFVRQNRRKNFYNGVDTMELLETHYNREDTEANSKILGILDETKSELSNTNNVIKFIEENTSQNLKLISDDVHHINEEVEHIKEELVSVKLIIGLQLTITVLSVVSEQLLSVVVTRI